MAGLTQEKLFGADDEYELERTFGWLFHDVHRLMKRAWEQRLREAGISQPQARVLTSLLREDGVTQTELADQVEMERAPLGRLLDRMEEAMLIERRPDPADRRVRRVFVTERAHDLVPVLRPIARDLIGRVLAGIDDHEVDQLIGLLTRLKANLDPTNVETPEDAASTAMAEPAHTTA